MEGYLFSAPKARALDRLISDGEHEIQGHRRTTGGGGVQIFQYVLRTDWSGGAARADIYLSDENGDGTLVAENKYIFDPVRQTLMADQTAGDPGWCHRQGDKYYAWQGPCEGSASPGGGGEDPLVVNPTPFVAT